MVVFSGNSQVKTGAIEIWPGLTPPVGYLFCDGSAISRTTYSELFEVIGTIYGDGDGSTTFTLPIFFVAGVPGILPVAGDGKTLGFLANPGAVLSVTIGEGMNVLKYTPTIGVNPGLQGINNDTAIGVDVNHEKSGLIARTEFIPRFPAPCIIKY